MSHFLSDNVTKRTFNDNERVVALVIQKVEHGYPDRIKAAAHSPLYPGDIYQAISFPIRGTAKPFGQFEPDAGQVALELLLAYCNAGNWDAFASKAFGKDGFEPEVIKLSKEHQPRNVRFGLFTVSVPTYNAIIGNSPGNEEKQWSVDTIFSAISECRDFVLKKGSISDRDGFIAWEASCYLRAPSQDKEGNRLEPPRSNEVMSEMNGPTEIDPNLRSFIAHRWEIGKRFRSGGDVDSDAKVREFLEATYDHHAFLRGLHSANFSIFPASYGRPGTNNFEVAKRLMETIKDDIAIVRGAYVQGDYEERYKERLQPIADLVSQLRQDIEEELSRSNSYKR